MPITEGLNGEIIYTAPQNNDRSLKTGTVVEEEFAIVDRYNVLKQVQFQVNPLSPGPGVLTFKVDVDGDEVVDLTGGGGSGWGLTGNAGTDPNTNYVGTSDAQDFVLGSDGVEAIRIYVGGFLKLIKDIYDENELFTISPTFRILGDSTETHALNWEDRTLLDEAADEKIFWGSDHLRFSTEGSEVMRITALGNVCIGATDPSAKLDLDGTFRLRAYTRGTLQTNDDGDVFANTELWDASSFTSVNVNARELVDTDGIAKIMKWQGGLGFFGQTPASQQTGGAATAGAVYTATEQTMLQTAYDALRAYGLLT